MDGKKILRDLEEGAENVVSGEGSERRSKGGTGMKDAGLPGSKEGLRELGKEYGARTEWSKGAESKTAT